MSDRLVDLDLVLDESLREYVEEEAERLGVEEEVLVIFLLRRGAVESDPDADSFDEVDPDVAGRNILDRVAERTEGDS